LSQSRSSSVSLGGPVSTSSAIGTHVATSSSASRSTSSRGRYVPV